MIDWNKPLRRKTEHGDYVEGRLLGVFNVGHPRLQAEYVVALNYKGEEVVHYFYGDGRPSGGDTAPIENAPEKVTLWVNVYRDSLGRVNAGESWPSEEIAKRHRRPFCLATVSFEVEVL